MFTACTIVQAAVKANSQKMGKGKFWPPGAPKPLNGFRWNLEYITRSRVCPRMQIHVALRQRLCISCISMYVTDRSFCSIKLIESYHSDVTASTSCIKRYNSCYFLHKKSYGIHVIFPSSWSKAIKYSLIALVEVFNCNWYWVLRLSRWRGLVLG